MNTYNCGLCQHLYGTSPATPEQLEAHFKICPNNPKKGNKNDSNYLEKPPIDLVTLEFLEETAKALGFGAGKYGRHNFKGGIDHSRLIAAALRHINQYNAGQDNDTESGLSHLAHAAASLNMLVWMVKNRPELDDRYKGDSSEIKAPTILVPCGTKLK